MYTYTKFDLYVYTCIYSFKCFNFCWLFVSTFHIHYNAIALPVYIYFCNIITYYFLSVILLMVCNFLLIYIISTWKKILVSSPGNVVLRITDGRIRTAITETRHTHPRPFFSQSNLVVDRSWSVMVAGT